MADSDYSPPGSSAPDSDPPPQKSRERTPSIDQRFSGLTIVMKELRPLVLAALAFFGSFTGAEVSENSRDHHLSHSDAPYVIVVETTNPATARFLTLPKRDDERSKDLRETTREAAGQAKEQLAEQARSKLEQTETPKTETAAGQQATPRPTPSLYKISPVPSP